MDELERRLRDDALAIRAEVPPELQARIGASLRTARPAELSTREMLAKDAHAREVRTSVTGWPLWLIASVTGAAAAGVVIFVLNRGIATTPEAPPAETIARSVPEYVREIERQLPLHTRTADLTAPLEEELRNLRSDLERARENVEEDLDFTF